MIELVLGRRSLGEGGADLDARTTQSSVTTEIVTDYDSFVGLAPEWNDAVRRAGVPHPFLLHEWFRTWWDCFGANRQLHIVVVRDGAGIAAIAPLMSEQVHMYGLPARKLDWLHNDHTPRADCIVTGSPSTAYDAIWNALRRTPGSWDLLQLSRLPEDSPTLAAFMSRAGRDGCQTGTWRGDVSPYLTLSGTWDSYHASLSAKFRSNLRNRLSRLRAFGEPRLEVLETAAEIADAREDAVRLESSGWKDDSRTSIASDPAVHRFYTLLADRAAEHGWLRLMFLTVGDRRIATSYGSQFAGRLFLFKTGYDPAYAACSPFKLLTYFATARAYAEGLRELDFLGDAEPWKLEWTDTSRPHDWLFVFADTMRARLLHSVKFQMVPELKRWRA
jgi:CelD/BcsL family acetyltransferase involved in cellulose biosynthesis